jgi:hypothetical protein
MATQAFVDLTGLQYYDGKLQERIAGTYATKAAYVGATSSANGTAGLVPAASSAQRGNFLRGDGTWTEAQTAKEIGYSTSEPTTSSTSSLDNESVIFYETQNMAAGVSSVAALSISGNASTADSVNHSMSISVDGGAVEGASLYTFNGSAEKTVNIAGGTGISLTGVSGTVTINANPFHGATASVNGTAGMVPASTVAEKDRFLRGDGTWAEVSLPDVYQGATSSSSGIAGLVPASTVAEKDRFLKGDGTWATVSTAKEMAVRTAEPTASNTTTLDNESIIFYDSGSSATAVQPVLTSGNQVIDGVKTFSAGVFSGKQIMSGTAMDCAAASCFTKTITANTTFSFTNVPSDAVCCVTLILTNGGNYTVSWPSSVKWTSNLPPDLTANGTDVLTFLTCTGGATWFGTTTCIGVTA